MEAVIEQTPGPNPQHPKRVTAQTVRLLHDYLLVRPLSAPSRKGLLFMPETSGARERNSRGIVLAVGQGDYNQAGTVILPMMVRVGDLVFFGKYAGTEEEFEGRPVLVMRETEVRVAVGLGEYEEVEHDDVRLNHLVEDWCDVCYGDPEDDAKARLEAERERFVAAGRNAIEAATEHLERGAGTVTVKDGSTTVTIPEDMVGTIEVKVQRRPCVNKFCSYVQQLVDRGADGMWWVGRSCGHEHPAGLEA